MNIHGRPSTHSEFDKLIELKDLKAQIESQKEAVKNPLLGASANKKDLEQPLLKAGYQNRKVQVKRSLLYGFKLLILLPNQSRWFGTFKKLFRGPPVSTEERRVYFDGIVSPPNYFENIVRNQKYTVFTIVFLVLYQQFKYFFNLFFLIIALSQAIPVLKVGYTFTYVAPLALVLFLTFLKEAWDDYKRYKRDNEANSQKYNVLTSRTPTPTKSSDLKVGHIVEVNANQRVPADLILLWTSDPTGAVFIRTDQLDGETDWKLRKAVRFTQNYSATRNLYTLAANIRAGPPIENIYEFTGLFSVEGEMGNGYREPLSLENTMWANTVLAAGKALAMVIYTGKETRMAMNSRPARTKVGTLDNEINYLSKLLFVLMVILAFILLVCQGFGSSWPITFFRFLLLLSGIIPISVRVNLDFSKIVFSYKINNDPDIEGTIARNSTIPEELGRIQFLLTDKTGTLTQNDMIFKKLSLESIQFSYETSGEMERLLKKQCGKGSGPLKDVADRVETEFKKDPESAKKIKKFRRDKEFVLRDLITALILCHNVTPTEEDGVRGFQASSPDEIALVKIAESIKMKLIARDQNSITIENAVGVVERYAILANFPFTSESKRMGIIVRHEETGRTIFYLKGADTIMKGKVPEFQRGFLLDECEQLASEGLRTLVITQKYLMQHEYEEWNERFIDANAQMVGREVAVRKCIEALEFNMEFLGITGVEDKLQEDVTVTLESIRNAGIQVWMLTGDKVETATCIAISAGLKSRYQTLFTMRDLEDPLVIRNQLNEFSAKDDCVLIIDGTTLKAALENNEDSFFFVTTKAPAVCVCRCSPTQKAMITEKIKKYTGQKTCAIGDGGNDVGMIQSADVGVGIVGKEGKQAALAADFSILKFKYINKLFLYHGRMSYKRTAVMAQFIIHRGMLISFIQMIFSLMFYFVSIQVYNGMLSLGYATIFTMFPVFFLIFDEDVPAEATLQYPPLYKTLQKGRELTMKTFLIWSWRTLYQAFMIMVIGVSSLNEPWVNEVSITFSALILAELLNIYSEVTKLHPIMIISQIATVITYFLTALLLPSVDLYYIFNPSSIVKILLIAIVSWAPLHLAKWLVRRYAPNENEKLMKRMRLKK